MTGDCLKSSQKLPTQSPGSSNLPKMKKTKKSSGCPSCPVLMFRCTLIMVFSLTIVTFLLILGQDNLNLGHLEEMTEVDEEREEAMVVQVTGDIGLSPDPSHIHLVLVSCGDESRLNRTMTSLKSVLIYSSKTVHLHMFIDTELKESMERRLSVLPSFIRAKFLYTYYPSTYPAGNHVEWRALFKPCASLRLFLPELLPEVEAVVYLDTDALTLSPIDDLHSLFYKFNDSQSMALAPNSVDASVSWYKRFARHPYYGELGLNSGVMLMNLTRMRSTSWSRDVIIIYKQFKMNLVYGDQDIINIWLSFHPDMVYELPCQYNYVPQFCAYGHHCSSADLDGVKVIHGTSGRFFKNDHPAFMRFYQVFEKYYLRDDLREGLLDPLVSAMSQVPRYGCGKISHLFYTGLDKLLQQTEQEETEDDSSV